MAFDATIVEIVCHPLKAATKAESSHWFDVSKLFLSYLTTTLKFVIPLIVVVVVIVVVAEIVLVVERAVVQEQCAAGWMLYHCVER